MAIDVVGLEVRERRGIVALCPRYELEVADKRCGLDVVGFGRRDVLVVGESTIDVATVQLVFGRGHPWIDRFGLRLIGVVSRSSGEGVFVLGQDVVDPPLDLGGRLCAGECRHRLATGDRHHGGDRLDPEQLRDAGVGVHVDLGQHPLAARLLCKGFERR